MLKTFPHIEFLSLHQFAQYKAPEEIGITFRENAILKAVHAAVSLNKWVLADDSGLSVPKLRGEPGVYSARYAGLDGNDTNNRRKLLKEMDAFEGLERSAYFECALAIASPEGLKKCASGICEGHILREERGRNGFGYDSLFTKNDYEKTFAELDEPVKNRISHRRKAFERITAFLETIK